MTNRSRFLAACCLSLPFAIAACETNEPASQTGSSTGAATPTATATASGNAAPNGSAAASDSAATSGSAAAPSGSDDALGEDKATVKGEAVEYEAGGVKLKGYLAYDEAQKGPRPGIIVVHEWWGRNDYADKRARMLAGLGYTALAVDMYGEGKTADNPDDAKRLSSAVAGDPDAATARFEAGRKLLADHETTDPEKIAAIGYCFGGAVVLNMARGGLDLDAVASFHGILGTEHPAEKGKIKGKVLVLSGDADPMVPSETVEAFKKEMADAGVDMKYVGYPGATHAFTNPAATAAGKKFELPVAYDKDADKKSWTELQDFLAGVFAG